MASQYDGRSLVQLRKELRGRNAWVSGRKADLVERLEAYDRNTNFGKHEDLQPDYHMELPASADYKDLHADVQIPLLTPAHVESYLHTVNSELDKKVTKLYEGQYINFIRVCTKPDLEHAFVTAEVRAEMKASLTYRVDISLSPQGVVMECQCECATGMGPSAHCKHAKCVLFGITEFVRTKKMVTLATCTQVLQTFHQAKKYLGSPVKAEKLQLHSKRLAAMDFDPRLEELRNREGYSSFFYSVVQNAGVFASSAVLHSVPPANPNSIVNDHDYLEEAPQLTFLAHIGLRNLSEVHQQCIERDTVSDRKLWKKERRKRLCSSDFGRLCKLTDKDKHQTSVQETYV